MPYLRPFRALRYDEDKAGPIHELVAPPYDIIYDDWQDRLYDRNPHNIIRLIKTRDEAREGQNPDKYQRAAGYVDTWMDNGVLRYDDAPSIYVRSETYTLDGVRATRYGFIALFRLEDFGSGIHPHERTLSGPKADRMKLVKATGTNLSQIFSVYRDPDGAVHTLITSVADKEPDFDFKDDQGIVRRMWRVSDPDIIRDVIETMGNREIIIADGHHRYETALAYKKEMEPTRKHDEEAFDYVTMYFSSADADGMTILPTHRKILGLDTFDRREFFFRLEDKYDVEFIGSANINEILYRIWDNSENVNTFGFYTRDGFRVARLRDATDPKQMDVELLHDDIIEKRLGITREDIAAGKYLHFSKSAEHAVEDVAKGRDNLAILMNGMTTDELFRQVLSGERLPQKSTYFFPKTMSGLVMYKIDQDSLRQ